MIAYLLGNEKAKSIFDKIINGQYIWYLCDEIIFEYKNVLRLKKFKLDDKTQRDTLDFIKKYSKNISISQETHFSRDRDDSIFLSLANTIDADIIYTFDKILMKADHLTKTKIIEP